jgi:hypothetical protein
MNDKYDGWAMRNQRWGYMDKHSFRRTRTQCIRDFISGTRWSWRQFRARGWECIKVRIVPVEEAS